MKHTWEVIWALKEHPLSIRSFYWAEPASGSVSSPVPWKNTMWMLLKQIPSAWCLVYKNNESLLFTFIIRCLWLFSCKMFLPSRWDISPPIWSFSAKSVIPQQNIELSGRHGAQLPVWEPLLCVTPAFVPLAEGRIKTLSQVECWAYASFVLV